MKTLFDLDYEEIKRNDNDHIATPRWIVEKIYNLINIQNYKSIWLPFDNYDSEFKLVADELGLNYKSTHKYDENGNDFFITTPPKDCELLISNPPFSIQNDILKRCFDLVKGGGVQSFILLLPLSTLETPIRADLFEKHIEKLKIIIFKKRIKFLGCKGSFNKACCFICYNIEPIEKPITWI